MKNTILFALFLLPFFALAQNEPFIYEEKMNDAYHFVPREGRATSPPYRLDGSAFSIRQVNVDEAGQNILGDAANEPSLVIDPTNPERMAVGWRQFDTIASDFRQAGFAFSFDEGENWDNAGPIEPGTFRSDPVLDADANGNFFYNSLSTPNDVYTCHVFKSDAGSNTWGDGVFAQGGDKQWMAIDRTGGATSGNVYAFWKSNISSCVGGFTRSLDGGQTYLPCEDVVGNPTRGTLVVSPTGELYACGSGYPGGFKVLKSSQPGVVGQPITWNLNAIVEMGGNLTVYAGPNPNGMLGQAWIDVDNSGGPTQGNVYLLGTVNSGSDYADVVLSRSTDGGQTWDAPVRINDDPITTDPADTNWQWFGSLSVAPNGRLDVTWYDTRDNPGTYLSRLYYSFSTDGGVTWSPNEALSEAFDPHLGWPQQPKIGDYNHQRSDNTGTHLAWAATLNGEQDVYYSYIVPDLTPAATDFASQNGRANVVCAPNPFTGSTVFRFSLKNRAHVEVAITDARGRMVERLKAGELSAGKNAVEWEGKAATGLYFYRVMADGELLGTGKALKMR